MEKSIIQQDVKYFVNSYSLIELFCGIWANYSVLKGSNTNESKKKPGLWCSETELIEYVNFLCGNKRIISSLMKKV